MIPNFDWPLIVESLRLETQFLNIISDGAGLNINGIPWREMFRRFAVVNEPWPTCGRYG